MSNDSLPQEVVVADVDMSFGNMVRFMIKWAIASIPAVLILGFIFGLGWLFLAALFTFGSY